MLYQLSYSRIGDRGSSYVAHRPEKDWCAWLRENGGESRIRTYEAVKQQIYSLPPLAAWVSPLFRSRSQWTDSNPRPADYKSAALPAELHWRVQQEKNGLVPSSAWPRNRCSGTPWNWAGKCMRKTHRSKWPGPRFFPWPRRNRSNAGPATGNTCASGGPRRPVRKT